MRKSVFVWLFVLPLLTLSASSLVAQHASPSTFDQTDYRGVEAKSVSSEIRLCL